jgi:hypothetical protein
MSCVVCLLPSTALVPAGCCGQLACGPCLEKWFRLIGGCRCMVCRKVYAIPVVADEMLSLNGPQLASILALLAAILLVDANAAIPILVAVMLWCVHFRVSHK